MKTFLQTGLSIGCILFSKLFFGQQLNIKNYSLNEGLPQSQVFAIEEDHRGYIWVGTRGGGIGRFDGKKFNIYTTEHGLINNFIYDIKKAKLNGREVLLIATNNGLSVYNGIKFSNYLSADGKNITLYDMFYDQHFVWLATSAGIFYFYNNKLHDATYKNTPTAERINCITKTQKYVWFGTDKGLHKAEYFYKQDTVKVKTYGVADGLSNLQVRNIYVTRNEDILICTYGGGLYILSNEKITNVSKKIYFKNKVIHDVQEDINGDIWIATHDAGVMYWQTEKDKVSYITTQEGLSSNHVHTVFQDKNNNLWFGTSGGGLAKYSREDIMHYNENTGLKGKLVYAVCMANDSSLWIGTSAKGVIRYKNNEFIHYTADLGFLDEKIRTIFCDEAGNVWFGTEGKGLLLYKDNEFLQFNNKNGLSSNWIKDIQQDNTGNLWLATAGHGLMKLKLENNKIKTDKFLPSMGFPSRINCLYINRDTIWLGTDGYGLYQYIIHEKKLNLISEKQAIIKSIKKYKSSVIIASEEGLFKYDQNKTEDIGKKAYLNSRNIYTVEVTDNIIWAATDKGLYKIFMNDTAENYYAKLYAREEGFLGVEACQNASHIDLFGNIWFGTVNGLTRLNKDESIQITKPRIYINNIHLFYKPLSETIYKDSISAWQTFDKEIHFNYNENHLDFEFTGLHYQNPNSLKYSWMLQGLEDKWSPLSDKNNATYINLPPGKYTFKVKACTEQNNCSENYASFNFVIIPPYWQTLWFKILIAVVILLFLLTTIMLLLKQSRNKAKRLNEKLQLQNKILKLEQKALQLQMNPHFIFHTLNSINGLMINKDIATARKYLAKFSKLMRAILENSRTELISLYDEIATLEEYLNIEKFTRNNSFDYQINIDKTIDTQDIFLPPMLIQPFVENSIIHGFKGLNHTGKISISFSVLNDILICEITDNGIGRIKASENRAQQEQNKKSIAMQVVNERLLAYRNNKHTKSLEIIDLYENNRAAGTKIILRINIR
jgi:ligand-binding sensor domain-containing protein